MTNERDVLKRFHGRSSCLRPLIDEIEDPPEPTTIVLKYLEDDLLQATKKQPLNRKELKHVSRCVLEALNSLHEGGYVHAGNGMIDSDYLTRSLIDNRSIDVKPDNVFVNYIDRGVKNDVRFSDVQLGDLGGACHVDSKLTKSGSPLGAPMWPSPEMIMETPWGTPTDIWPFGAVVNFSIPCPWTDICKGGC